MSSDILPPQTKQILKSVSELINKTFPIPQRFKSSMPSQIAELSKLLTNQRGDRSLSYLGRPNFLSAYLHYFLPWNLYRLCILLNRIDITLKPNDTIIDLGCGPLTFASALWIAREDLRNIPLEIICIDRSAPALEAGKLFFKALCGADTPWKINIIKEDIDLRKTESKKRKKAALVCAVNLFNEIYENIPHNNAEALKRVAANTALIMHNLALPDSRILTVEPGVPQSGKFISFLRASLIGLGRFPLSPCTHTQECPCAGKQKRWCHFAFETVDAPKELHRLSQAARIPKERLVFSFLLTAAQSKTRNTDQSTAASDVRVISDAFALPYNKFGRYGCCDKGLVLLTGDKHRIEKLSSLSLVKSISASGIRDKKSGACIIEI